MCISTGGGVNNFLFCHLSSLYILLPSQFCARLPFFASTTATDGVRLPLGLGGLAISYDHISPQPPMRPIQRQQCSPPLPTSMPDQRVSIDATVVRNLTPLIKTSFPPDFCDPSPPVDLLKIMTTNIGLFYVASISSLFVDISQITLHPTSIFSPCSTRQDTYRRPRLQYHVSIPSGGAMSSPPPPLILQVQWVA